MVNHRQTAGDSLDIYGTSEDNVLVVDRFASGQTSTTDTLVVRSYGGNDAVTGSNSLEEIYGGTGNDRLNGALSADKLYGEDGDDVLIGGDGNDALVGGTGNDILAGGYGNDTLKGNNGADIYYFEKGFGQDEIVNADSNTDSLAARQDWIVFSADIQPENIEFNWRYDSSTSYSSYRHDLVLRVKGTSDSIIITDFYLNGGVSRGAVAGVRFEATGEEWSFEQVVQRSQAALDSSQVLFGFDDPSRPDQIDGGASPDEIYGWGGDDVLAGGHGADTLEGGEGADQLSGDEGSDSLMGDGGIDRLYGGGGAAGRCWFERISLLGGVRL